METWQTTEAGRHLRTLLDKVGQGEWQLLVSGHTRAAAVLADAQEIGDLIGAGYRFRPQTAFGEQGAEIWLPEVGAHVMGATLDDARRQLAEAMISFAQDWEEHLRHVADLRLKAGYVRRIQLAGDEAGVLAMLDRDAESEDVSSTSGRLWPDLDEVKPRRWLGPHDRIVRFRDAQADQSV